MERTWKPRAAGILCIIAGAIGMIPTIAIASYLSRLTYGLLNLLVVVGIMPIVGGIYALRRRRWRLALAGSIAALIAPVIPMTIAVVVVSFPAAHTPVIDAMLVSSPLGIPGILALIFVIKGKGEFK